MKKSSTQNLSSTSKQGRPSSCNKYAEWDTYGLLHLWLDSPITSLGCSVKAAAFLLVSDLMAIKMGNLIGTLTDIRVLPYLKGQSN